MRGGGVYATREAAVAAAVGNLPPDGEFAVTCGEGRYNAWFWSQVTRPMTAHNNRDEIIEQCAVAAEQQDREGYEWVRDSLWQKILQRAGANVRKLKAQQLEISWRRVNDEPFEYAIQQGQHGDEFVRLQNGDCLRRQLVTKQRPDPDLDRTLASVRDAMTEPGS